MAGARGLASHPPGGDSGGGTVAGMGGRDRLAQAGNPFGGSEPSILWSGGQAAPVSGGGGEIAAPGGGAVFICRRGGAKDQVLRKGAGVPDGVAFQTKPAVAGDLIEEALGDG
jgi:hypothetical protein